MSIEQNKDSHTEVNSQDYQFLKIGGLNVAYQEKGQGTPVLFVHGFGSSSYTWTYVLKELPLNFRYILLDLPGFGKSDKPKHGGYYLIDQATILERVIQALNLNGLVFVGHSYGGGVGITYLLARGGQQAGFVRACVLIDSLGYQQTMPHLITQLTIPLLSKLGLRFIPPATLTKASLKAVFFDRHKIPGDLVEACANALRSPGARHALLETAKNLATKETPSLSAIFSTLTIPSLVIWGEKDGIVPLENANKFAGDLPNCTLKTIANCGHAPQEECPSKTAKYISDFLVRL